MRNYENFTVWKTARDLAIDLHRATSELDDPSKHELFQQIRGDGIDIMSKIAYGSIQKNPFFIEYLLEATSITFQCRSKIELALRLEWIDDIMANELDGKLRQLSFKLYGLQRSLKEQQPFST